MPSAEPQKLAVIGAGFAGLAVAWHLLAAATPSKPLHVEVFDVHGIAGGASGAAAGLLHPFSPRGKVSIAASRFLHTPCRPGQFSVAASLQVLWNGADALRCALRLVAAAQAACPDPVFDWRHPFVRLAATPKQVRPGSICSSLQLCVVLTERGFM